MSTLVVWPPESIKAEVIAKAAPADIAVGMLLAVQEIQMHQNSDYNGINTSVIVWSFRYLTICHNQNLYGYAFSIFKPTTLSTGKGKNSMLNGRADLYCTIRFNTSLWRS